MPRVLLVDDHPPFRAAAAMVFGAGGWDVVGEASTGEEAVVVADAARPDVILMDVRLPGIDGIEATRRIVARLPGTDVVLMSSRHPEDLPDDAATCGAVGYLPKDELSPAAVASLRRGGQHPLTTPG